MEDPEGSQTGTSPVRTRWLSQWSRTDPSPLRGGVLRLRDQTRLASAEGLLDDQDWTRRGGVVTTADPDLVRTNTLDGDTQCPTPRHMDGRWVVCGHRGGGGVHYGWSIRRPVMVSQETHRFNGDHHLVFVKVGPLK